MLNPRQFLIKLEGTAISDGNVPFKLLADVLTGIQQTFYYIALADLGREPQSRGRIPQDIQQLCELRRVSEQRGSYEMTAEVAEPPQGILFPETDLGNETLKRYLRLISFLDSNTDEIIIEQFPDSIYRRKILRSIESYCPKEGDEWDLTVSQGSNGQLTFGKLTKEVHRKISFYIAPQPETKTRTVTGELVRLHLDEHKLGIKYPPSMKLLDCFYDPELDDFIIQNLKGFIQVTGQVQVDESGATDKIIDVKKIAELDLSPIKITTLSNPELTLILNEPIQGTPIFVNQEIVLELSDFNIIVAGVTRDEVIRNLEEDMVWLHQEYGLAPDDNLSGDAQQLKRRILELVKEVRYVSKKT